MEYELHSDFQKRWKRYIVTLGVSVLCEALVYIARSEVCSIGTPGFCGLTFFCDGHFKPVMGRLIP